MRWKTTNLHLQKDTISCSKILKRYYFEKEIFLCVILI